jgi:type I restriction enzyme S subunit
MKLKNKTVPKSKVAKSGKAPKNGQTEIFESHDSENSDANTLKGWEIKCLGDVSTIVNGGTPKSKVKEYWNGNINWITPADLGKLETVFVNDTPRKITELGLQKSSAKIFPENSVILSTRAPIGHLAINTVPMSTNQGCRGIIPNDNLDTWYLYYFLKGNIQLLNNLGSGATFLELSTKNLSSVKIPIPPLPEQKRIVSILDRAFTAIDKAKANAEQNLQNARALFESYLQGVFEKENDGWVEKTLKELTTKIGSGATPRGGQKSYKSEGISLVRSMNVHDSEFRERNLAFIDGKQAKELDGVTLQEDDVLLNITGASVARCCVFPKEYLPARVNQHVSIIRPKKEMLDAKFLNLLLTSKPYKDQLLITGEQGATRQAITKAQIETFKIFIPELEVQQTIVRKLDALRAETQKLEAVYQKKLDDLEELKKSILQKAFAGELTQAKHYDLQEDSFSLVAEPEPGEIPKG